MNERWAHYNKNTADKEVIKQNPPMKKSEYHFAIHIFVCQIWFSGIKPKQS